MNYRIFEDEVINGELWQYPDTNTFVIENLGGQDLVLSGSNPVRVSNTMHYNVTQPVKKILSPGETTTCTASFDFHLADGSYRLTEFMVYSNDVSNYSNRVYFYGKSVSNYVITNPKPYAPVNLTYSQVTTNRIELNWEDRSSLETGYKIYKKTSLSGDFVEIGSVGENQITFTDNSYDDTATITWYRVCAYTVNNKSNYIMAKINSTSIVTYDAGFAYGPNIFYEN